MDSGSGALTYASWGPGLRWRGEGMGARVLPPQPPSCLGARTLASFLTRGPTACHSQGPACSPTV